MNYGGVRAPLFLTILVMAVVPLCAAFYLLDRAVATSLDLGFNGSIIHALDDSARNLKTLKRLDPGQQERYREKQPDWFEDSHFLGPMERCRYWTAPADNRCVPDAIILLRKAKVIPAGKCIRANASCLQERYLTQYFLVKHQVQN